MSFDQKQNTEALQERHSDVYKRFFAENNVVVSSCFTDVITSGISWRVGAPMMRIKLPFRIYLGLKANAHKGNIVVGNRQHFDVRSDAFLDTGYETMIWGKTLPYVESVLKKMLGTSSFDGVTINVLTERGEDRGFDTPPSLLLLAALQLYYGLITPEFLQTLPGLSFDEINQSQTAASRAFNELLIESTKIWTFSLSGSSSGCTNFSGFVDSVFPIVYVTEERGGSVDKPYLHFPPWYVGTNVERLQDLCFWGLRLNEMAPCSGVFPVDVAAIFPGSSAVVHDAGVHVKGTLLPSFDELRDDVRELFKPILKTQSQDKLPPFLRNLDIDGHYWQEYGRGEVFPQLYVVRALIRLYQRKLSSVAMDDFLEAIDATAPVHAPFEESPSENIQHIMRAIRTCARKHDVRVALRLHNWRKMDGYIVAYSRPKAFQDELRNVVESLQESYNENIHIDFASYKDGWGENGLRIEQFISKGIYSKFVGSQSYRVRGWEEKQGEVERVTEDVEKTKNEFDVLLDKVDGKIYIKGGECTSRELPTQKAAIEVLVYLLEHRGETVSNKVLPAQTYTSYRNEFQGKIVTPLNQLLKKRLSKDLGLKIHGRLMAFDVQFNPADLKIGILEKMG